MQEAQFKEVWAAGTEEGICSLLTKVLERVRELREDASASMVPGDRLKIVWNPSAGPFFIEFERAAFWIRRSSIDQGVGIWNQNLESFYNEVIEPIKERTGGVASGIGTAS